MTIASAFNEIAVANGGTADNSGTIAGAVDALTDALAGSDVAQGATIEDGVRVLGEYIGGGGGVSLGNAVYDTFYSSATIPVVGGNVPEDSYNVGVAATNADGEPVISVEGTIMEIRAGLYITALPNNVPLKLFAFTADPTGITNVEELPVNTRTVEDAPYKLVQLPDNSIGSNALVFMIESS